MPMQYKDYAHFIRVFWANIEQGDPDACWPWIAGKSSQGYGQCMFETKKIGSHRLAYELTRGTVPEGLFVLHSCDNPACCNPNHLRAGTQADNIADMFARRRENRTDRARGENHPRAKLSDAQVEEIRRLYAAGGISHRKLAAKFGISKSYIPFLTLGYNRR